MIPLPVRINSFLVPTIEQTLNAPCVDFTGVYRVCLFGSTKVAFLKLLQSVIHGKFTLLMGRYKNRTGGIYTSCEDGQSGKENVTLYYSRQQERAPLIFLERYQLPKESERQHCS